MGVVAPSVANRKAGANCIAASTGFNPMLRGTELGKTPVFILLTLGSTPSGLYGHLARRFASPKRWK